MSGLEIHAVAGVGSPSPSSGRVSAGGSAGGFAGALRDARAAVKVSAHARQRLAQQNVPVNEALLSRLGEATDRAAEKGSRESLMILGGVGFIVNVPNRTVKTAVATGRMQEGIFTNIDSAVILKEQ